VSVPDDPLGVAWIRLLAVDAPHPPQAAWEALWPAAEASAAQVSSRAAALPQEGWVGPLLESCGFHLATEVLFLEARAGEQAGHDVAGLVMADMAPTDLEEVVRVDCLAFSEIWRHSLATLAVAQGKSAVARVASLDRRTVGYAISTASPYAGHLARLAVDPAWQGKGIGTALIADTLTLMARRGADRVTVNTQADNLRSQDLYRRMGFRETGPRFPVFEKSLAAAGRAPMP
jgi:ribosomal protein S18 acetylase RimI-like enzyme